MRYEYMQVDECTSMPAVDEMNMPVFVTLFGCRIALVCDTKS